MVQRLAVVLDQHVLVIAANTHTSNTPTMDGQKYTHPDCQRNARAHIEEMEKKRKSACG